MPKRLIRVTSEYIYEISKQELADEGGYDLEDLADSDYFDDSLREYLEENEDQLENLSPESFDLQVLEVPE